MVVRIHPSGFTIEITSSLCSLSAAQLIYILSRDLSHDSLITNHKIHDMTVY